MKIGFVNFTPLVYSIETPYKEPLGGSESSLCYLAEALAKRGHSLTIFGRLNKVFSLRNVLHKPDSLLKKGKNNDLDFLIIQNKPYVGPEIKSHMSQKTKLIFWSGHGAYQPVVRFLKDKAFQRTFAG